MKEITPTTEATGSAWVRLPAAIVSILVVLSSLGLTACGSQAGGQLGRLQTIADHCPSGKQLASFSTIDASQTGRSKQLERQRLAAVRTLATETAVCTGHLRVEAFSSSSAATETLFDGELQPAGATQNAQLRRVPGIVDGALATVQRNLRTALRRLPADGTDVLAQLGLAAEFARQLGPGHIVKVQILSDGVQTTGAVILNVPLTNAVATDLGQRVTVPEFPADTSVTFAGIGKVAGPPPPTAFVDALKAFFSTACARTKATCTVVTDLASQEG